METDTPHPRENPDLFGHESAERHLLAAWNSGRLPHSWLIAGPEGIGKATLAHRFARFVLSGGGGDSLFGPGAADSLYVAPDSPLFRRTAAAGHSDLMTLERQADPESGKLKTAIVVDDVRKAGAFLSLTAGEGGWRIVIVDSADEMNQNAANALLKILEEPPKKALIFLISHSPGGLLPTIRSRCSKLTLTPLDDTVVTILLQRFRPEIPEPEIRLLARLGEGSVGRALRIAETDGLDFYRALVMIVRALPRLDAAALHRIGDGLARREADAQWHMASDLVVWWLARMIGCLARSRHGGEIEIEEFVEGEHDCARRMASLADVDRWTRVWERIIALFAQTDAVNLDRKQVLLNVFHAIQGAARA